MDEKSYELCRSIIPATYVQQAVDGKSAFRNILNQLLQHKKIPDDGLSEFVIEQMISAFAEMDSNNFSGICGAGEREGRIFSGLVARRHFCMAHGVGRSGELTAVQPKAAGSSIIAHLANKLALHALKVSGAAHVKDCFVVPMATGMTLCFVFMSLRQLRPSAKYILWPRIDQKSCFKSMLTAGFVPVVIENVLVGDELRTDTGAIRAKIFELGAENILCVHTTTSCFAPRAPDNLPEVAKICQETDIPHVVNNAYGAQLSKCMHLIEEGARVGRLDVFVQSLDKNFMVPVGGSLLAGYNLDLIRLVSELYPGRASATPSVDLFITLLSMGLTGYKKLLAEREDNFRYLHEELTKFASLIGERVLTTPNNKVSLALSCCCVEEPSKLGSMLFVRNISGARVQCGGLRQQIGDYWFENFGGHCDSYPVPYLNLAAAIGVTRPEIDLLMSRLARTFKKIKRLDKPELHVFANESSASVG